MKNTDKEISVTELKRLLVAIVETRSGICFRYRKVGEMWYPNFLRVLKTTEKGVILNDEIKNRLFSLDLTTIMQFEIDGALYGYEPHYHYYVRGVEV